DVAYNQASKQALTVDTISVTKDMSDVSDTIADIDKHEKVLEKADDTDIPRKQEYVSANILARSKLSIFTDKLTVSSVDTSAFAVQYRIAHADYERLTAEAHELLVHYGIKSGDEMGTITQGFGKTDLKVGDSQGALTAVKLGEFQAARRN